MTDIIVHQRSGAHSIEQEKDECFNEVQRLNPSFYNKQQDDEEEDREVVENPQAAAEQDLFKMVTLNTRNRDIGSIVYEQELKLMLLRHWTLFDSLCNSNYLVSKLQLWKEHGQKELRNILAKLGISLDQAKQKY